MKPRPDAIALDKNCFDLNLPSPETALRDPAPATISWQAFMAETADRTRFYLVEFDDREQRARSRNDAEFVWH
jgi:hypothetical protein